MRCCHWSCSQPSWYLFRYRTFLSTTRYSRANTIGFIFHETVRPAFQLSSVRTMPLNQKGYPEISDAVQVAERLARVNRDMLRDTGLSQSRSRSWRQRMLNAYLQRMAALVFWGAVCCGDNPALPARAELRSYLRRRRDLTLNDCRRLHLI